MINIDNKFKIGDKVKVIQLDKNDSVDITFKINEELTIKRILYGYYGIVYFFVSREYGLYEKQLEALPRVERPKEPVDKNIFPKFKIGDKVRVNSLDYNPYYTTGEVLTVNRSRIFEKGTYYWFKEKDSVGLLETSLKLVKEEVKAPKKEKIKETKKEELEEAKEEKAIITYTGNSTIVNIKGKKGKARFNGVDKYDKKKGILIATARALGYKGDMVCELVELLFDERLEDNKPKTQPKEEVKIPKENIYLGTKPKKIGLNGLS